MYVDDSAQAGRDTDEVLDRWSDGESTAGIFAVATLTAGTATSSWDLMSGADSIYWGEVQRQSRWRQYVLDRFSQLAESVGQPGYPSLESLNRALRRIDAVLPAGSPTPSVMPSEEGGVELRWQKRGCDVQIDLESDGADFIWMRDRLSGDSLSGDLLEHREELADILADLGTDPEQ